MKKALTALALLSLSALPARADSLRDFLRAFHADPARNMQRLPDEVVNGETVPRGQIKENLAGWEEAIRLRDSVRAHLIRTAPRPITAPTEGDDSPEKLIEPGGFLRNMNEIHAAGLTHAVIDPVPWADSYWPLANGNTAARYADPRFPETKDWTASKAYYDAYPGSSVAATGNPDEINKLSPAEKYDFVMGDTSWTLTNYAWRTGAALLEKYGKVPGWMGICHGWAAAAHVNSPLPRNPVQITGVNGKSVTFWPQDAKALMSMLWANASPRVRFVGNRCNVAQPAKNQYGRVVDKACFDVNPATLHLGLVNQAGVHKRSVIMDATFDLEVWNHPVAAYRFRYFNPQSWQESSSVAPATIPVDRFQLDKFKEFRSPNAVSVVGVMMDVTYVVEVNARRLPLDPVPPVKTLRFIYDLELDAAGNVLGGEWYTNAHPDFLWTFDQDQKAATAPDAEIADYPWTKSQQLPAEWTNRAMRASNRGAPLATFVYRLAE